MSPIKDDSSVEAFSNLGNQTDTISVRIGHRIIQLFSEGLYSSSNKAIEELVSNAYDAGAENVHIILSPDLRDPGATIVVIDDGEGMDPHQLKQHWIIGESTRRRAVTSSKRKPIGKFGIGKLSTYVLGSKLTHISRSENQYYAATMNYRDVTRGDDISGGVFNEQIVEIPLRMLSREQAQEALRPWMGGTKEGYQALDLFGPNEPKTWTAAIISDLKKMGKEIKLGRLLWVLKTAMPQTDDFRLFLDGDRVSAPPLSTPLKKWVIGKDIVQLNPPAPDGFIAREDPNRPEDSEQRFGIYHEELGRITGYIAVFEEQLDSGKPKFEQSSGFFVYVRGRRVNVDDPGFGIERNLLRHGTFSRFRMVVHIDSLDDALRSSRESFQQGDLYEATQNFLRAGFNLGRNHLVEHERLKAPGALIAARISSAPGSLTRKPLLSLAYLVAEHKATPFYVRYPSGLSKEQEDVFLQELKQRIDGPAGLIQAVEIVPLDSKEGLAILEIQTGKLFINSSHPFVAAFQEFFSDSKRSLPLEMMAMSEILLEAHLYLMGLDESVIRDVVATRDELLRQFVRSSARRTAGMIALALLDSRNDESRLEEEMRAAFEAMGFANVIRIGGSNKPDGTAEAHLAAAEDGTVRRYKVGLEAKSGQRVSAHRLNIAAIARHMKDYECDHHLVIGNGFATSTGEDSASVREIKEFQENTRLAAQAGIRKPRTITLMEIDDLARLIRIVSAKRVGGLSRIRELFQTCTTPEESREWIDKLAGETTENWPYKEILETIWQLAQEQPNEAVEYAAVVTELRHRTVPIRMKKPELIECCKAMQVMARGVVYARENTVEIDRRPDLILEDIRAAIGDLPNVEKHPFHL